MFLRILIVRIFLILNNIVNTDLIQLLVQEKMDVTVGNNYFKNVNIDNERHIFYFFSDNNDMTITNETLIDNTLDDLYSIGAVNKLTVRDFKVINNKNTGTITETSAILKISKAN